MAEEAMVPTETDYIKLATEIVAAFVQHNAINRDDLPKFISTVYASLRVLNEEQDGQVEQDLTPAVPLKKSIRPDHIVCLEDGKKFKSLKRHLATEHGLTPGQYREKWKLPTDYPMVAPAYSQARSSLARRTGLGKKRKGVGSAGER